MNVPIVTSIFSEFDKNELAKPAAVVIGDGPCVTKGLQRTHREGENVTN